MTSQLPSPPSSRPSTPSAKPLPPEEGEEALSSRLDSLLEQYLVFLDKYTSLRAELSTSLSAGFFALAQANRNATSTLGAGRRYGEEGFDVRMKARRVVEIQRGERPGRANAGEQRSADLEDEDENADEEGRDEDRLIGEIEDGQDPEKEKVDKEDDTVQEPSRSKHDTSLQPTITTGVSSSSKSSHAFSTTFIDSSKDPLKWYGILIPPALRTCQAQFTSAVSSSIPNLLSTISILRGMEDEIWLLRKELGLLYEYALS